MQSCGQVHRAFLAKETPESRNFAKRLSIVRCLGEGFNAVAYHVRAADGRDYALRLERDIETAAKGVATVCAFSALPSLAFVQVHGWFVLQGLPTAWIKQIGPEMPKALSGLGKGIKYQPTARTMCTLMELGTVRLLDPAVFISLDDARVLLFMALHALYVAKKELGEKHGDIHVDNIIAVPFEPDESVTLRVGENTVRIRGAQYMPKIIDPAPMRSPSAPSDVDMLSMAMAEMAQAHDLPEFERELKRWESVPAFLEAAYGGPNNVAAYETLLVSFSRYFDVARVLQDIPPDKIGYRQVGIGAQLHLLFVPVCSMCGADARYGWSFGEVFCSRRCGISRWFLLPCSKKN